jgi:two-component system, OmpR family, copper resistance phosphate regulon response regulator CusR
MSADGLIGSRTVPGIPLIDDESRIRSVISRALEEAGYATFCASNGEEAVRLARTGEFGLVILDLVMPDMDGRAVLARVRVLLRGDPRHQVLRSGELRLDVGRMQADTGHGPIALTRLEFLLLKELMEHADQPVSKDELLASIWGYDDPGSNVVDVCVRRLRSKLGYKLIKTVRGAGYQLAS